MPEPEIDEIREALAANDFSKARRLLETFLTAPRVDSKKLTWVRQKFLPTRIKKRKVRWRSKKRCRHWRGKALRTVLIRKRSAWREPFISGFGRSTGMYRS
jgi:hypothetical protein